MNFLLQRSGQQLGPFPLSSLTEMYRNGSVRPSDLIWVEGAPTWVLVSDYTGGNPPAPAPPPLPATDSASRPAGAPPAMPSSVAADQATVQMVKDVEAGGRFVIFSYCISIVVLTFKRPSGIVFLRRDQDGAGQAIGYSLLSGVLGWWGIPWGPIWTIAALVSNARGGRDITLEVLTDRVGATAAAAIMARRARPTPASWLMKSFRVALIAIPLLLIASISFPLIFDGHDRSSGSSRHTSAFEAANDQIDVNKGQAAFGNSGQAIAVASDVSRSMKVLRDLGFEGGSKKGQAASQHEFLTYCDLRARQCIVMIHVPELRRFTSGAKDSLATMAWGRTQAALRQQNAGTPGMKVIVAMRGIALYDRVMTGQFTADPDTKDNGRTATISGGRDELEQMFNEAASKSETANVVHSPQP